MVPRAFIALLLLLPLGACGLETSKQPATPVVVKKNARYDSVDDILAAARASGLKCASPQKSLFPGTHEEHLLCSNKKNSLTKLGTSGLIDSGATLAGLFIASLDQNDFDNGAWLVGPNWAIGGPGVAKLRSKMGGKLITKPAAEN